MLRLIRWPGFAAVVLAMAAACGSGSGSESVVGTEGAATTSESEVAGGQRDCVPLSAFENGEVADAPVQEDAVFPWKRADPVVAEGFDADEIIPGGPPPDGIEPIDEPCFVDVATADRWLKPQSPVLAIELDGDTRAYPLAIMTQHEIVNDVVGGEPVVITYCPLCNSGLAFFRTVEGKVLDFGTSGRLYRSNLVMYDRQTKTLWTQFTGRAVVGEDYVGTELERIPTSLLGWRQFKQAAPGAMVLSRQTMPDREYGRNPYPGYEDSGDTFLFQGPRDDRLPPNSRVVGLGAERDPVAVPLPRLRDQRVVALEVDGRPVTVWWSPGQASALDAASVAAGEDVGSTAVFVPVLDDGTRLTFVPDAEDSALFHDEQTGSTWNLLGEAVDGPLAGTELEAVSHDDTFWFVWFAFQPETVIATAPGGSSST